MGRQVEEWRRYFASSDDKFTRVKKDAPQIIAASMCFSFVRNPSFRMGLLVAALLAEAILCNGCATVMRGANEKFTVQSEPSDAVVRLSTGQTAFTPATFTVERKGDIVVVVSKEGYERVEVVVKSSLSGGGTAGFLGNAVLGGIVGGAWDIGSGATMSHDPNPLKVVLARKATPPDGANPPVGSDSATTPMASK